jgi:hypothetical protein
LASGVDWSRLLNSPSTTQSAWDSASNWSHKARVPAVTACAALVSAGLAAENAQKVGSVAAVNCSALRVWSVRLGACSADNPVANQSTMPLESLAPRGAAAKRPRARGALLECGACRLACVNGERAYGVQRLRLGGDAGGLQGRSPSCEEGPAWPPERAPGPGGVDCESTAAIAVIWPAISASRSRGLAVSEAGSVQGQRAVRAGGAGGAGGGIGEGRGAGGAAGDKPTVGGGEGASDAIKFLSTHRPASKSGGLVYVCGAQPSRAARVLSARSLTATHPWLASGTPVRRGGL